MDKEFNCIHCHKCQNACDFLAKYKIDIGDQKMLKELAYSCFLCGRCSQVCPVGIDGRALVMELRKQRAKEDPAAIRKKYKGVFLEKENYIFRNWKHVNEGSVFFPGCNFPSLFPKTSKAISRLLADHGIGSVYECCGKPIAELGAADEDARIIEEIKRRLRAHNITEVILACPNCRNHFAGRLDVKVTSIFTKLQELGLGHVIEGDMKLFLPCPDRNTMEWIEEMKPFIKGDISFVENVQCCGLGGSAIVREPELSKGFADRFKEYQNQPVYTYCASCTGRLRRNGFASIEHVLTRVMATDEDPDIMKSYINRVMTRFK